MSALLSRCNIKVNPPDCYVIIVMLYRIFAVHQNDVAIR